MSTTSTTNARPARDRSVAALLVTFAFTSLVACSDYANAPVAPIVPDDVPASVDVAFCEGGGPLWVAFQDGDGAWTRALPTTAGGRLTFHHTFANGRGGVATAREFAGGLTALSVLYGAPAELSIADDTRQQFCTTESRTLLGSVAGLDTNEFAVVGAGFLPFIGDVVDPTEGRTFAVNGLTDGPQDLLAMRATRDGGQLQVKSFIVRRDLRLPDGATLPVLDFASPEAFAAEVHTVTLTNAGPGGASVQTGFRTAHGEIPVAFLTNSVVAATRPYYSIPATRLGAGDLQSLTATSFPSGNMVRSVRTWFHAAADRTITFAAAPEVPQIKVASSTPTLRLRAHFSAQADYDRITSINYHQGQHTVVTVGMTAAYASRGAGDYDLVMPELIDVDGFDPRWMTTQAAGVVLWTSSRVGGTLGLGTTPVPRDGDVRRSGSDAGFLTP